MAMGVPKTTQILFGLFLTNPSREVQLFPGGRMVQYLRKPIERVFSGGEGSGPSDPPLDLRVCSLILAPA